MMMKKQGGEGGDQNQDGKKMLLKERDCWTLVVMRKVKKAMQVTTNK